MTAHFASKHFTQKHWAEKHWRGRYIEVFGEFVASSWIAVKQLLPTSAAKPAAGLAAVAAEREQSAEAVARPTTAERSVE